MAVSRARWMRWLFAANLLLVGFLVGYKVYLNLYERDFAGVQARQLANVREVLSGRGSFSFAVVGNINNSVGIFERKIVPMLNDSGVDFVVSAGNAVSGGGEDKYRALYRTLGHLRIPYLLAFGENEYSGLGSYRFYEHFGPYFFSFTAGSSQFVFLDSTGKTSPRWQLSWLGDELRGSDARHTFLFTGHPLVRTRHDLFLDREDNYLYPVPFREGIQRLAATYAVDAVFSANLPVFETQVRDDTTYVTTGGAGGLVLNNDTSYYHFVKVTVGGGKVAIEPVRLGIGQHAVLKTLESLWFFIHSLFYVGYLNFILLVSSLSVAAIWLYNRVFAERDYYPSFDVDATPYRDRTFRVAMFTNNYLPFIGGVPLSIERLRTGLAGRGHEVMVVAPSYGQQLDEEHVLRARSILALGKQREFRVANIFQPGLRRKIKGFRPDVIHIHHPFWLGSLGLRLARRLKVPAVYTYHTRLEHYAHYVPLPGPLFRNLISHSLVKRFANKCDAVIVPTHSAEEYLRLIGVGTGIFVQPTGVDCAAFASADRERVAALRQRFGIGDHKVFVSVSRLSREKNIEFMIDALAEMKRQGGVPFKFLVIGDGQDRGSLQARIDSYGAGEEMLLTGPVTPEDIPAYYALGDAFLFASKTETQGMVVLEAMAAGLPVVAVRSSGIDDVVQDGFNGFKTPENREVWSARAGTLITDEALHRTMAGNARSFAQQFDIDAVAGNVAEVYAYACAVRGDGRDAAAGGQAVGS